MVYIEAVFTVLWVCVTFVVFVKLTKSDLGVILKYLLLPILLALTVPCFAQDTATNVIRENLIEAPESVAEGKVFQILLPSDLPFTITPIPSNKLNHIDADDGKRHYVVIDPKPPGYTITIDYAVVHPTDEELAKAPTVPDPNNEAQVKAFKEYFRSLRADEIYRDSHFVKVGKGPDPPPDPEPDNLTGTAKAVYEWAKVVGNKEEIKTIANNYAAVLAAISAGAYKDLPFLEARSKIVSFVTERNRLTTANSAAWATFGQKLLEHTQALDSEGKLDSVDKIKVFFEAIQKGLEVASE